MGGRLGAITRAIAGGLVWGVLVAWWYGAPLLRGVWLGFVAWAPAVLLSVRWRDTDRDTDRDVFRDDTPVDAFVP
jgi:hypothetical protein